MAKKNLKCANMDMSGKLHAAFTTALIDTLADYSVGQTDDKGNKDIPTAFFSVVRAFLSDNGAEAWEEAVVDESKSVKTLHDNFLKEIGVHRTKPTTPTC